MTILTEKGGVGKTTTAIHLGAALASTKNKILLIDFDSQRNLSQGYKIDTDRNYNVLNFLQGTGDFRLKEKAKNLFVMSGSKQLESFIRKDVAVEDAKAQGKKSQVSGFRRLQSFGKRSKWSNEKV